MSFPMKLSGLLFLLSFATPTPMMGGRLATPDRGRWCEGKRRSLGLLLLAPARAVGRSAPPAALLYLCLPCHICSWLS